MQLRSPQEQSENQRAPRIAHKHLRAPRRYPQVALTFINSNAHRDGGHCYLYGI